MNTSQERERVQKTTIVYIVVMVLIVVLILIAVQDPKVKTIAIILILLVGCAAIVVQWLLLGKQETDEEPQLREETAQEAELAEEEAVSTQTGASCMVSGQYYCKDHPEKKVSMVEGKRFPPCRGDNKGHSATWVLEE